jgi:N-acetylneuraminate epimerase
MNLSTLFLLASLTLMADDSCAQEKKGRSFTWSVAAELPADSIAQKSLGFAGPVAGIHNNVLMVAGGANFPGKMPWLGGTKKYYPDVYVFAVKGASISLQEKRFRLSSNIAYAACCSTPQGILYAGGENESGISSKVFLLQWDPKAESVVSKALPSIPVAVTNAAATSHGNMVYLVGGETNSSVSDQCLQLDLNNPETGWTLLPALPKQLSHAVVAVQSNGKQDCIYVLGGRKKNASGISDLYSSVFEFDLLENHWTEKKPLPYPLSAGTGMAAGKNAILLFGGDRGTTFSKVERLIAAISAEKNDLKKTALIEQKNELQSQHPGFSKAILSYHTIENSWTNKGLIPFEVGVTTTAVSAGNVLWIPGGEIKAGVRTPQILMGQFPKKSSLK